MKISFLGACREVGRSAMLADNVLMDYGVKLGRDGEEDSYPLEAKPRHTFLSHAHLDHCGFLPYLVRRGYNGMFCSTELSFQLSKILLEDSIKVSHEEGVAPKFGKNDIKRFFQRRFSMEYDRLVDFGGFHAKLVDAGHIPGSAGIYLKMKDKSVFYTGDMRHSDTRLVSGATKLPQADVLIMESTYGNRNHPDRIEEEKRFARRVAEVVEGGGVALVPVFAIGRSQEMLLVLDTYGRFPVYLDGMARAATDIIKHYTPLLREGKRLDEVSHKIKWVHTEKERSAIAGKPAVIITTAGMMQAGPARSYMKRLYSRTDCAVLMPGYQIEGTPGRILLETGKYALDSDQEVDVSMPVEKFDFSSHADHKELLEIVRRVRPKEIFVVHGDNCERFAAELEKEFGIPCHAPSLGEEFTV